MNFARTNRYNRSAIPYIQKLLNKKFKNNPAPGEAGFGAAGARAGVKGWRSERPGGRSKDQGGVEGEATTRGPGRGLP